MSARTSFPAPHLAVAALVLAGLLAAPALAQPPPVSPQDFVNAAGGADGYEIMAAHVALTESHDTGVRAFAQEMVREHTAALSSLAAAAGRAGLEPPSGSVGGDQTMLLAALQGLRGADFDKAYVRQQVLAHRQALATEGGYARMGSNADLKAAAQADLPMIERHLQRAHDLKRSTGGE